MLDILPRLTHFDGKDLQSMHARVHEQRIQRTQQSRSVSSSAASKKYAAPSSSSFLNNNSNNNNNNNNNNNSGFGFSHVNHSHVSNRSHLSTSRSGSNGRGVIPGRQRPSSPHISTFPLSSTRSGGGGNRMVPTGIDISRVRSSWTNHSHHNQSTTHGPPFNHSYTNEQPSTTSTTGIPPTVDEFDLRLIRALRKRPYIGGWDSHSNTHNASSNKSNNQSHGHNNNSANNSIGRVHMHDAGNASRGNDVSFRGDIEQKTSSSMVDDVNAGKPQPLWKSSYQGMFRTPYPIHKSYQPTSYQPSYALILTSNTPYCSLNYLMHT